jgi:hypothetical protein
MYTAKDIATVKAVYENLVFLNLIRVEELDGFGEPIPRYTAEGERQLVKAITECSGFPWRCTLENCASEMADMLTRTVHIDPLERLARVMNLRMAQLALEELTESIFPSAELQFMLKNHHEYLDLVQDNVRAGKLFADEMEEMRKAS